MMRCETQTPSLRPHRSSLEKAQAPPRRAAQQDPSGAAASSTLLPDLDLSSHSPEGFGIATLCSFGSKAQGKHK